MNHIANKIEMQTFALRLQDLRAGGHVIVYCDVTNYNVCIARAQGRAMSGRRAVYVGPASPGRKFQIQCAVLNGMGVVVYNIAENKIDMDMNASFLLDTYITAVQWANEQGVYRDKKIVLVIDNEPAPQGQMI